MASFSFTLTGYDELERGTPTNTERIKPCVNFTQLVKTLVSIDSIVDVIAGMIAKCSDFCDF